MNEYVYRQNLNSPYSPRRHGKKKKRPIILLFMCVVLSLIGLVWMFRVFDKDTEVAPIPQEKVSGASVPVSDSPLLQEISDVVEDTPGTYAVVVKQLSGGDTEVYLNEDMEFQTASLYKLWIMATVYKAIDSGSLSLTDELTGEVEELNEDFDIASESAEMSEGEVEGTVEELMYDMITISDNYKALLLAKTVGMSKVSALLKEYGLKHSKTGSPPRSTASDIAEFYEKLYRGEIVTSEASEAMLELLSKQRLNDRIPKPLPKNTKVAHKTGELGEYKHDAGIVYGESGDYILVIMSETPSQEEAVKVEQEISRVVWEYFEGKSSTDTEN